MKSGLIIVNKEKGLTSQNVVSKVKRILNIKKAGHIGTLDPLAEGVLPILLGDATKMSQYLIDHDKTYMVTLKLGIRTETADGEGKIIEQAQEIDIYEEKIKEKLSGFIGKQQQKPHIFSAVKIGGKKLYEYARNGESVDIPSREIEIYKIEFIEYNEKNNEIIFEVECSKGTYIRVLCEDIAKSLGTIGYMKKLIRTKVADFTINEAIRLEYLNEKNIILVEEICKNYKSITLKQNRLNYFLNGGNIDIDKEDGIYKIYVEKNFIGIGKVVNKVLKRDIIINN